MGFNSAFKGLKQFNCTLVGRMKGFENIKMHGATVKKNDYLPYFHIS